MQTAEKIPDGTLIFEPHGLVGFDAKEYLDDAEAPPFPFGYISVDRPRVPIFELTAVLEFNAEELRAIALKSAAANELYDALVAAVDRMVGSSASIVALREMSIAALRKARGE